MSRKRAAETYQPDDGFVEDAPSSKKSRNTDGSANQKSKRDKEHADLAVHINDQGDSYWELTKSRRLTVGKFQGRDNVDIREYYEKDGKRLPGKKGISLSMDQLSTFITLLPEIEALLAENGVEIPRPDYKRDKPAAKGGSKDDDEGGDALKGRKGKRANIEATSDEDGDI